MHNLVTRRTQLVSVGTDGAQGAAESYEASISGDGTRVAFASFSSTLVPAGMTPGSEIFLRDLTASQTSRISVNADDRQGNGMSVQPAIRADGTREAFTTESTNLVPGDHNKSGDVFVRS